MQQTQNISTTIFRKSVLLVLVLLLIAPAFVSASSHNIQPLGPTITPIQPTQITPVAPTGPTQPSLYGSNPNTSLYDSTTSGSLYLDAAQPADTATCTPSSIENLTDVLEFGACFINRFVIPLVFSIALAGFFFGVVRFTLSGADETKRKEGRQYMLWGIIALFVMVSIWGILLVLTNTFGLSTFGIPQF